MLNIHTYTFSEMDYVLIFKFIYAEIGRQISFTLTIYLNPIIFTCDY